MHEGQPVGALQQPGYGKKAAGSDLDPPRLAHDREFAVGEGRGPNGAHEHADVARAEHRLLRQGLTEDGILVPTDDYLPFLPEKVSGVVRVDVVVGGEEQIDLALVDLHSGIVLHRGDVEPHARRPLSQPLDQRNQGRNGHVIRAKYPEGPVRARGIEQGGIGDEGVQTREGIFENRGQGLSIGGRVHALAGRHQQFVAEIVAQACQGRAHRGLAKVHATCRAGDAPGVQQGVKRYQQI